MRPAREVRPAGDAGPRSRSSARARRASAPRLVRALPAGRAEGSCSAPCRGYGIAAGVPDVRRAGRLRGVRRHAAVEEGDASGASSARRTAGARACGADDVRRSAGRRGACGGVGGARAPRCRCASRSSPASAPGAGDPRRWARRTCATWGPGDLDLVGDARRRPRPAAARARRARARARHLDGGRRVGAGPRGRVDRPGRRAERPRDPGARPRGRRAGSTSASAPSAPTAGFPVGARGVPRGRGRAASPARSRTCPPITSLVTTLGGRTVCLLALEPGQVAGVRRGDARARRRRGSSSAWRPNRTCELEDDRLILPIRTLGDPVLREPARPVTTFDRALRALADDMLETMYAAPGVGLAGPQVGVSAAALHVRRRRDRSARDGQPGAASASTARWSRTRGACRSPARTTRPGAPRPSVPRGRRARAPLEMAGGGPARADLPARDRPPRRRGCTSTDSTTTGAAPCWPSSGGSSSGSPTPRRARAMTLRVAFLGNDAWSVPALEAIDADPGLEVDARGHEPAAAGRPRRPAPRRPPVGRRARDGSGSRSLEADGRRARAAGLDGARGRRTRRRSPSWRTGTCCPPRSSRLPPHGALNLHFSLLPRWRGAAPVQHALLAGDDVTGVTVMRMDEGLDTGPILAQLEDAVRPEDDAGSLGRGSPVSGARLLVGTIRQLPGRRPARARAGRGARDVGAGARPRGPTARLGAAGRRARAAGPRARAASRARSTDVPRRHRCKVLGAPAQRRGGAGRRRRRGDRGGRRRGVLVAAGEGALRLLDVAPAGRRRDAGRRLGARRPLRRRRAPGMTRHASRALALEAIGRVIDEGAYSNRLLPGRCSRDRGSTGGTARSRPSSPTGRCGARLRLDPAIEARASRPSPGWTPASRTCCAWARTSCSRRASPPHAAVERDGRPRRRARARVRERGPPAARRPTRRRRRRAMTTRPSRRRTGLARWAVRELRLVVGRRRRGGGRRARARGRRSACARPATPTTSALALEAAGHRVGARAGRSRVPAPARRRRPRDAPGFDEGAFAVQDQASAFVVRRVDAATRGPRGRRLRRARAARRSPLAPAVGPDGTVVAADLGEGRARGDAVARPPGSACGRSRVGRTPARRRCAPARSTRVLVDAPVSAASARRAAVPSSCGACPGRRGRRPSRRAQLAIATAVGRARAPGRAPRLRGVHLPAGRDRRGRATRCSRAARTCDRSRTEGPTGRRRTAPALAAPARRRTAMFVAAFERAS